VRLSDRRARLARPRTPSTKTITVVSNDRAGYATRLLSLVLERRLTDRVAPALRHQIFTAMMDSHQATVALEGGLIKIDLREPRKELASAIRALPRARVLVQSDPDIKGAAPVFRGTRKQVHMIAGLVAKGSPGALADLLLVDGDPLADLHLIEDPARNFVVIMKDGTIHKQTI
jgi:hypothetical protein